MIKQPKKMEDEESIIVTDKDIIVDVCERDTFRHFLEKVTY